ncbi:MAG: hypothetical protein RLZZ196_1142 [Bacteroidota bacterium]|jgi:group I intron endonuclease
MDTEKGIIYCACCIFNSKKYIGQTKKSLEWRIKKHYYDTNQYKAKFQNALLKYGKDGFIWGIIEECDYNSLNEREFYWIEYYDTYNNGYNSTHGGDGGYVTHCREYKLMSPWGEIIEGSNIMELSRKYQLNSSEICNVLNKKIKSHKGWKLPETKFIGTEAKVESKIKEFILVSPNGEIVKGKNRAEFCRKYGLSKGNLSMLLNNKPYYKSVKGWKLYSSSDKLLIK